MNTATDTSRAFARPFMARFTGVAHFIRYLVGALALIFTGNAYAVISVDLGIQNETEINGSILVSTSSKVVVRYSVVEDSDAELHQNDRIELLRQSDDSVVATARRGKKKNGKVSLKVRNSAGERLYVHYRRKGKAGAVIQTASHPDDGGDPLWSIARANLDDITIAVNAMGIGAASIPHQSFNDSQVFLDDSYASCQLKKTSSYSYYHAVAAGGFNSCHPWAAIQLPQGRTITGLHCAAYDNNDFNSIQFVMERNEITSDLSQRLLLTGSTTNSTSVQQLSDTTIDASLAHIDNRTYAYHIRARYFTTDFSALGTNGRIYGCSVTYL